MDSHIQVSPGVQSQTRVVAFFLMSASDQIHRSYVVIESGSSHMDLGNHRTHFKFCHEKVQLVLSSRGEFHLRDSHTAVTLEFWLTPLIERGFDLWTTWIENLKPFMCEIPIGEKQVI